MIKVIYNKTCGRCVQSEPLTSGMVGQPIELEYSADFDGLTLTAVFTNGKTTVDVLNPDKQCIIPHEVLDTVGTVVKVGIYAVRGNDLVIPTVYATIGIVLKGADPSGDVSADPTLPVWAQIQESIGNINDLNTEAKNNLVAAINEAAQSGGGGGGGSTVELDTTLTQSGKAADAKAVGDALANISGDGLSKTEKNLILTLFKNAMYTVNMTDTVMALENLWSGSGGGEEIVTYTITNTLSNVTSNNSATSATAGSAYSATLTANDGYTMNTVTVLMGGVDVTDSVYSNGAITIGSVTGNVSITATAVEASSAANWENGVAYTFTDLVENEYVNHATGEFKPYANYYRTGYVPCFGAAWLKFTGENASTDLAFYNSSKAFISGVKLTSTKSFYLNVPANSAYFAISAENGVYRTVIPYAGIKATWEDGVPYTPTIIENSYVNGNGTFETYNGWNRTDYLNCVGANTIEASISTRYFSFFDVNKEPVIGNRNDKTYTVPVGACYFIISESAANMASIVITPHA